MGGHLITNGFHARDYREAVAMGGLAAISFKLSCFLWEKRLLVLLKFALAHLQILINCQYPACFYKKRTHYHSYMLWFSKFYILGCIYEYIMSSILMFTEMVHQGNLCLYPLQEHAWYLTQVEFPQRHLKALQIFPIAGSYMYFIWTLTLISCGMSLLDPSSRQRCAFLFYRFMF